MYQFELFTPQAKPTPESAELTRSVGNLIIKKKTAERHGIDGGFCSLYWDSEKQLMGIDFHAVKTESSLPIHRDPKDRRRKVFSLQIGCKEFCLLHHIDLSQNTILRTAWSYPERKLILAGFRVHVGLKQGESV